jgi:hypothetical protein
MRGVTPRRAKSILREPQSRLRPSLDKLAFGTQRASQCPIAEAIDSNQESFRCSEKNERILHATLREQCTRLFELGAMARAQIAASDPEFLGFSKTRDGVERGR